MCCCGDRSRSDLDSIFARVSSRDLLELLAIYEGRKLAYALQRSTCADQSLSATNIAMPNIIPGQTKIGDTYGRNGLLLTAYVQTAQRIAFVSDDPNERENARRKLGAAVGGDGKWHVIRSAEPLLLTLRPLSDLPLMDEIKNDDSGVLKGWQCQAIKEGGCINIYKVTDGSFAYSMKSPGMNVCRPYPDETCALHSVVR
jgi:hypothetical protein